MSASEALTMPRVVLVSYSSSRNDLGTFDATSSKLFFITSGAVNVLFTRDERLGSNRCLAHKATKALFVPLSALVFHFLGSGPEDFTTSVTPSGVHRVVARSAENLISLGAKLLVDQRQAALVAQETGLVPVAILVRQILRVDPDDTIAVVASVGEDRLVALDAVRMLVPQNVALSSQRLVALPAAKVS